MHSLLQDHSRVSFSRRILSIVLAAILVFAVLEPVACVPVEAASSNAWMIILGTNHGGTAKRLKGYKNAVADVQYYYPHEIKALKSGGRKIYSYMSIGSLETYRPYYKRFKKYTIGKYENWADERWIDVSKKSWQDFIVNELVASVRRKGADGLWLDNTDVYYKYRRENIYKGLLNIISRIHSKHIPI